MHSATDMFSVSANVMLVLIMAAYIVGHAQSKAPQKKSTLNLYRLVPLPAVILVTLALFWLLRTDVALLRSFGAWESLADEDYVTALEQFESAAELDASLGTYEIQETYTLGLLANENPDVYLQQAIAAHETMLENNPTFDLGYANLSVLASQNGDHEYALALILHAIAINPDIGEYYFLRGQYQAQLDQNEAAAASYTRAIRRNPEIVGSAFWQNATNAVIQQSLQRAFDQSEPHVRVQIAILSGRTEWLATEAQNLLAKSSRTAFEEWALGRYIAFIGDHAQSLQYYAVAISEIPYETRDNNLAIAYAERAEIQLAIGDVDQAERDAHAALFLNQTAAARAYYVLAQILLENDADNPLINDYLARAVPPRVVLQEYVGTVYRTVAQVDWLPQARLPGFGAMAYEPWLLLAERYDNDDDLETLSSDVFEAIRENDPYVQLSD